VQATQTVKATAAAAQAASAKATAKTPAATPAVVVKINQAVAAKPALPTYNAAGKTNTVATTPKTTTTTTAKAPEPAKTTPQPPAAAKSPAAAATPAPAAAAKPQSSSAQEAPAADGSLYATGEGSVKVDIMASDSGYENKIYWSADNWKTKNYLGVDNQTASFDLGKFEKGTKIEFGIDNGQGDFFKTGSGNTDGFQHTRVSSDAGGTTVGFEDLRGGGDQDFNDAIIRVGGLSNAQPGNAAPASAQTPKTGSVAPPKTGSVAPPKDNTPAAPVAVSKPEPAKPEPVVSKPEPAKPEPAKPAPAPVVVAKPEPAKPAPAPVVAKPAPAPAPAKPAPAPTPAKETKDNRSGLGDGTNPGNGAGRVNSPNTGTENPNQSKTVAKTAATPTKVATVKKV